jgi:glycine oxidase
VGGTSHPSTVIVGGGVIGMSIALSLVTRGVPCSLVDPNPGHGASWAAAGMLSPAAEVAPGEEALLAQLTEAARLWPGFAAHLAAVSGIDVDYCASGSVLVAASPSDAREAARLAAMVSSRGIDVEGIDGDAIPGVEPAIAGGIAGAWLLPGDHRVDNRLLVEALVASLKSLGVRFVEDRCTRVEATPSRLSVTLEHQGSLEADTCVLATGATRPVPGTEGLGIPSVRPVRGTTLRLGPVAGVQPITHTIRAIVDGVHCYVVPRRDGSVVVGATSEEQGYVQLARAGGVAELLEAAITVVPCLEELAFEEVAVGFRPATADHLPFVGRSHDPRVLGAVGHYRNGVLLAPLAASMAATLILDAVA